RERGRVGGRTLEIQRLIGRSLRAAVDLEALGEHTITVDCDVILADGGTRTAAITGAAIALHRACAWLVRNGRVERSPWRQLVAASAGAGSGLQRACGGRGRSRRGERGPGPQAAAASGVGLGGGGARLAPGDGEGGAGRVARSRDAREPGELPAGEGPVLEQ